MTGGLTVLAVFFLYRACFIWNHEKVEDGARADRAWFALTYLSLAFACASCAWSFQ